MIRFFLLAILSTGVAFAAPNDAFRQGNDAYAQGDFATAKRLYLESLQTSPDENTWYNLGNAYFRLDQPGAAAAAYERVLALAPNHPEATANLRFVRQKTGARFQEPVWSQRVLGGLPPAAAYWLAIGTGWLGLGWLGVTLWRRTGRGGVIGGAFLLTVGAGYALGLHWWGQQQSRVAIVLTGAEAKAEPSKEARTTETLPPASRVRWISGITGWDFYEMPSGERAWLPVQSVERILPPQS